jgi:hypothetical protein
MVLLTFALVATFGLSGAASAETVVDQENLLPSSGSPDGYLTIGQENSRTQWAQTFVAQRTGRLEHISLYNNRRAGGASKDCVGADSEDEARGGRRPDVRVGDPEPPQRCSRRRARYQEVLRRLHESLFRPPGGTACTSESATPITAYAVPPLSKLGPVPSRLGLIPELRGERQRSRWTEARMDRAKRIQWQ